MRTTWQSSAARLENGAGPPQHTGSWVAFMCDGWLAFLCIEHMHLSDPVKSDDRAYS